MAHDRGSTPRRRTARLVGALLAATLVGLAPSAAPAGAAPARRAAVPPITFTVDEGAAVQVKGIYQQLVGHFTNLQLDDIIWYGRYETKVDRRWTPCVGCPGGPFTSTVLAPQMPDGFTGMVGDFAGDDLDDIFWLNQSGGADYLWTNVGGTFTSSRLDMSDGYGRGTVLHDRTAGKDDILWFPMDLGPDHAALWIFPDDGSGAARTRYRPTLPPFSEVVGDFDGDGRDDLFFTSTYSGCDYQCPPPPATTPSVLWRHPTSTGGFVASSFTIKNPYLPVVGRFGGVAATDDLLLLGGYQPYRSPFIDGPDHLWLGRSGSGAGTFAQASVSLPYGPFSSVVRVNAGDRVLAGLPDGGVELWRRPGGVSTRQPIAPHLVDGNELIFGRFTVADRQDWFVYSSGSIQDRLVHMDS